MSNILNCDSFQAYFVGSFDLQANNGNTQIESENGNYTVTFTKKTATEKTGDVKASSDSKFLSSLNAQTTNGIVEITLL